MVSIIIPYVRVDGYNRCVEAVLKNCGKTPFQIVSEEDTGRIGCNPMVNNLVGKSKYNLVCFLHDDSVPQPGFLTEAVKEMAKFEGGWGTVGFNDMISDACTHWMVHKNMLRYFPDGVFYSEDYIHTRCDLELKEVSESVGRYRWAKDAKVKHLNPIHCKDVKRDDLHRNCYSKKSLDHDQRVYEHRKRG